MGYRQSMVLRWVDAKGATRTQSIYTADDPAPDFGAAGGIITALQAASNAGLLYKVCSPIAVVSGTPTTDDYKSVRDYLVMNFRSATGSTGKLNVPAPKAEMFLTGADEMDPDNALVQAIRDAMFAGSTDVNGNAWTTLISGRRARIAKVNALGM